MNIQNLLILFSDFFEEFGYITVFASSFIEITPMGWIIPGGVILAVAGFFANTQTGISLVPIILSGTLGAWLTFVGAYFFGKRSGMWLVKKLHQEKNAEFAKNLLKKHGGVILTTSMMANLTRFWVAYIAGVEGYDLKKFLLYSIFASFTWVSVMSLLGFVVGYEKNNIEKIIGTTGIIGWGFLIISIFIIYKSISHEYKHFQKDEPHNENS